MLEPDDVVVPHPRVAFREIAGQQVIVSPADNSLITLNETGSAAWAALDGRSVGAVAAAVAEVFDVPPERALDDVREFLGGLLERGLVARR